MPGHEFTSKNHHRNAEIERPLSVYDNHDDVLVHTQQVDCPTVSYDVSDPRQHSDQNQKYIIQARTLEEKSSTSPLKAALTSSSNSDVNIHYENVVGTIQLRNSFRRLQMQQLQLFVDEKPAISDAKSLFFGISYAGKNPQISENTFVPCNDNKLALLNTEFCQTMHNPSTKHPVAQLSHADSYTSVSSGHGATSSGNFQNIPHNSAMFQKSHNYQAINDDIDNIKHGKQNSENEQNSSIFEKSRTSTENNSKTQAVYMSTTVPQNMKTINIAGRHTPTRTSLRHSRMVVINKNFHAPQRPNPLNLRHPLIAKLLLILQLCCGLLIGSLSLWVLLWAPNTRTRDNPYWSGAMLTVASILALTLIEFRRIPRHRMREHSYMFLRLNSSAMSMLATVAAFAALVFATLHLDNVASVETICMPAMPTMSNAVCICFFGGTTNMTLAAASMIPIDEGRQVLDGSVFQYRDLSCTEVRGAWKFILFTFTLLNMVAFIVSVLYLIMLCFPRRRGRNHNRPTELCVNMTNIDLGSRDKSGGKYSQVRSSL